MEKEKDLFESLDQLEKHLARFERNGDKKSARKIQKYIVLVKEEIKREYPDLVLDGDDEVVCTCGEGTGDCDKHEFVEIL